MQKHEKIKIFSKPSDSLNSFKMTELKNRPVLPKPKSPLESMDHWVRANYIRSQEVIWNQQKLASYKSYTKQEVFYYQCIVGLLKADRSRAKANFQELVSQL